MQPKTLLSITLLGLLACVILLVSPDYLVKLINVPGFLIVLGGTLLAVMLSKPQQEVIDLLRELPAIYKGASNYQLSAIDVKGLMRLAHLNRSGQLRLMEREITTYRQPMLRKGIQLILDRCTAQEVSLLLTREKNQLLHPCQEKSRILRLMSSYAPAFGMLGTLLGLIHMLYSLGDTGIETVGATMGFALLTTLYGLVLANLVFKPLAIKLERASSEHEAQLNMLAEGVLMVHDKKHPLIINDMLESYRPAQPPQVQSRPKSLFAKMLPMVTTHVD